MSLKACAHSVPGTLRQDVLIDGRYHLRTDQPARLGGNDTGPAPHELLPAALAACIAATLATYARTKQWDLGEIVVDVDYDNRSAPRSFDVDITVSGEVSDEQLARLHKVAAACPLRRSIEAGFEFHERLERRPAEAAA